jgi:uncharacterized membrane protein YphA (DoxX/SURF4 family)
MKNTQKIIAGLASFLGAIPFLASAHEAYVLPRQFFWQEIAKPVNAKAFAALQNPHDVAIFIKIAIGVIALYLLNFFFRRSAAGRKFHTRLERFSYLGPVIIRLAVSAAFFFGARSNAFLGPELPISQLPYAHLMQFGLYAASAMILFGFLTEIAAIIGLVIFSVGYMVWGVYLGTYLNYLGEFIVLILFGMRTLSFDRLLFGKLKGWRAYWEKYGSAIVRIFYGAALIYAGITVKFLHPDLTLRVIQDWHLTKFTWLFPSDPLLIVLGGGLAEAVIGLFVLLGFQVRLTVFISLFYITLSLMYFRELVWPHILLYGISINLLIHPEHFALDNVFFGSKKNS